MSAGLLVAALFAAAGGSVDAQNTRHQTVLQPGGIPGIPVLTGITQVTNGVTVTWDSPPGYCQLYQKRSLRDPAWQLIGTPFNPSGTATVSSPYSSAFFRVFSPPPQYAAAQTCAECHTDLFDSFVHTVHASTNIFTNSLWVALGGRTNGTCLACHTVGYNLPTGFTNQTTTPQLAGVQCENCHGPAANHASNTEDPTAIPRVEVAGTMCGGCHQVPANATPAVAAAHPPYYPEWSRSAHGAVTAEVQADFASAQGPTFFIPNCGKCHSGTVREAYLRNLAVLPNGQDAGAVAEACATCHDPHTNQPRNPLASLQDYHTAGNWATNYNPNINLCGQCHNDRGATYKDTSRPPHHSPQYNMLLGTVGVVNPNDPDAAHSDPATHAFAAKQCVTCHMQAVPYQSPSKPGTAGHTFGTITNSTGCGGAACHGAGDVANLLVPIVTNIITTNPDNLYPVHPISEVHSRLVEWAITKGPAILGTAQYGTNAWAYSVYSPPDPFVGSTNVPPAELQPRIPKNIRMARFNLYLVQNDGSFGTHNFNYTVDLLNIAYDMVTAELAK